MTAATLLPLSVMMPLLGAALALLTSRRPKAQRAVAVGSLSIQFVFEIIMLLEVDANGPLVMHIGGWDSPVGITLVADRLSALMLVVSTLVTLAVLVYAIAQGHSDGESREAPVSVFHPAFLIMAAGVSNAFLAGDLFNLYVSFEILLTASYVLLTLGSTLERIRSGAPYVVISIVSSIIFLSGIGMIYAATGTLNMADLADRLQALPTTLMVVLQSLLLIAFGVKAAIWPMSAWLPDSYPTASAPVTAVFAGLLTKVGIYAIIRTQTLLFPGGFQTLLMIIGLATMVIGILGAIAQNEIKRLLSFTLVSHIGYLVFGVAIGTQGRPGGDRVLRRAPHPRADRAVPGDRAGGAHHRDHQDRPAGRAGEDGPGTGSAVLHPGDESRWGTAVLRLPRQGGARRGGHRDRQRDRDRRGGRRCPHQPADVAGDRAGLGSGILASTS